jgi:hypothetical protein
MRMSSAALKQRTYRERLKAGRSVFAVEVDEAAVIAVLQARGFLPMADPSHDDISTALERVIAYWIEVENANAS